MKSVGWWAFCGAAVPAALLVITFLPVTVAMGVDDLLTNLGTLTLALVMIVPPGAVGGAVIGIVDAQLYRYVTRADASVRRRRTWVAALGLFVLVTGLVMTLLRFTATDMTNVAVNLAFSAACAVIPTGVALRRYPRREHAALES